MERYRTLPHTADTAIEAEAPTLEGLIENLAYGMFDSMVDIERRAAARTVEIRADADSVEDLVVATLSELLFAAEAGDMILCTFEAAVDDRELSARVTAGASPAADAELRGPPIKAVTYHDLVATRLGDRWYGRVVFDV